MSTVPEFGEIWQDQEGVLLAILHDGYVFAFGNGDELRVDDFVEVDRPHKRVFDVNGNFVGDGPLDYPGGHAVKGRGTA